MIEALRHHDKYKMQNVQGVGSPLRSFQERTSVSTSFKTYLDRVELDNRSIFIGNLPNSVTDDDIINLFGDFGTIEKITIRDSLSKYDCKLTMF
jgi:RNA recognition motif-containing protein